jgi:hypothetical protein
MRTAKGGASNSGSLRRDKPADAQFKILCCFYRSFKSSYAINFKKTMFDKQLPYNQMYSALFSH